MTHAGQNLFDQQGLGAHCQVHTEVVSASRGSAARKMLSLKPLRAAPSGLDGADFKTVQSPRWAHTISFQRWFVENQQLEPDVRQTLDPGLVSQGRDQQLEAAVRSLLGQ